MNPNPELTDLIRDRAIRVRRAATAYEAAPAQCRTTLLDEYLTTEANAVAALTQALGGVVAACQGYNPYHPLNLAATASESCAVRLVAAAVLNLYRPLLETAAQLEEEISHGQMC